MYSIDTSPRSLDDAGRQNIMMIICSWNHKNIGLNPNSITDDLGNIFNASKYYFPYLKYWEINNIYQIELFEDLNEVIQQ